MARPWKWALWATILATVLIASACAGVQVTEQPAQKQAYTKIGQKSITNDEGNKLVIVGVDFDPPLTYVDTIRQHGVTLLVAVENQGSTRAQNVRIVARLILNQEKKQTIQREGVLKSIEPGHIEVYHFPRLRNIPIRRAYTLHIQLMTTDGQRILGQRTYTIKPTNK